MRISPDLDAGTYTERLHDAPGEFHTLRIWLEQRGALELPHPTLGFGDDKKNKIVRIMRGKTAQQIVGVLNNKAKIDKMTLLRYHAGTLVARIRGKAAQIII